MAARILVCDNEEPLRALVRATLAGDDYEVVEARDGEESLEVARRVRPDLVILDVMMPARSGLEVLQELRRDPELASTPVVMLTARTQAGDRESAAAAGADTFLAKPFSPLELIGVIDHLLGRR